MTAPRDIREAAAEQMSQGHDKADVLVAAALNHYQNGHWQEAQAASLTAMAVLQWREMHDG